jgi:hypothetical protein
MGGDLFPISTPVDPPLIWIRWYKRFKRFTNNNGIGVTTNQIKNETIKV